MFIASPMNLKPILLFTILQIPISQTFLPPSQVSPLVKFTTIDSAWNSLCSVVLDYVLHINIVVLSPSSHRENVNILLKHIEQISRKSVTQWDGLPVLSNDTKDSFRVATTSGFLMLVDDSTTYPEQKSEFKNFWRRIGAFLTPESPAITLILSQVLDNCDSRSIISALRSLPTGNAFIMITSCPHRVFFFDTHNNQTLLYLTQKNFSMALNILHDLTVDMRRNDFRVAMTNFFPSAVFQNGPNVDSMTGVGASMLREMSRYFNFTPEVVIPQDGIPFGVYSNGTGSGTLRNVVEKEADASFIGRFVMDYGTTDFDYTIPYEFDSLCVVVPKNPPLKMYQMLFLTFEPKVWQVVAILHVTATVIWLGIKSLWLKTSSRGGFINAYLDVFLLSVSGTIVSSDLKARSARFFAASLFFFHLVLMGTLQGMLYKFTASPIQRQMRTLEELDRSGLIIETIFEDLVNTFPKTSQQEIIISLGTKVRHVPVEAIWNWKPGEKAVASLVRKNCAALTLFLNGNPNINVVDECPRNFYLAYILRKNHQITPYFNQFIYWCLESGLVKKWLDDTYFVRKKTFGFSEKSSQKMRYGTTNASIDYVAEAVFILGSGLAMSLTVFLGEIISCIHVYSNKNYRKLGGRFTKRL